MVLRMNVADKENYPMTNPFLLRYWDHKELIRGSDKSGTNTNSSKTLLEWARLYLSKGFSVIPLKPESSEPAIENWKIYTERHPAERELCEWFQGGENNIGIVTGGISGIDVALIESDLGGTVVQRGEFPSTPTVEAGYGFHLYYKHNYWGPTFHKHHSIPDIDLISTGNYVVAPPSYIPGVGTYSWFLDIDLERQSISDKPEMIASSRKNDDSLVSDFIMGVTDDKARIALSLLITQWAHAGWSLEDCIDLATAWDQKHKRPRFSRDLTTIATSIFIDAVTGRRGMKI